MCEPLRLASRTVIVHNSLRPMTHFGKGAMILTQTAEPSISPGKKSYVSVRWRE